MIKCEEYEQKLARLEEICTLLAAEDTPLERSITLYEEASGLAKGLAECLEAARLRVNTIEGDGASEL